MNYHREWADETDALSEFDLADSAEPDGDDDPEASVAEEGAVPDEADEADVAEQHQVVPLDDDEEPENR
jgi:hypothetical protein